MVCQSISKHIQRIKGGQWYGTKKLQNLRLAVVYPIRSLRE